MALTQSHLTALDDAIAAGVLEVRYPDGSQAKFDSFDKLLARRNWVAGQLGAAGGAASGPLQGRRVTVAGF
jgi:hypothetical protein